MFVQALEPRRLFASGLFAAPLPYGDSRVWGLTTGDFDGDGSTDIAAVVSEPVGTIPTGPIPCRLHVLMNDGAGRFALAVTALPDGVPAGIVAADLNDDELDDLAVLQRPDSFGRRSPVGVFFSAGSGTFTDGGGLTGPSGAVPEVQNPVRLWGGDFDRDGRGDLLADYMIVSRSGAAWRATLAPSNTLGHGADAAAGDFNGDGRTDQVISGASAVTQSSMLLSNADGTFRAVPFRLLTADVNLFAAGDFDGDGFDDIAGLGSGEYVVNQFLSRGDGRFRLVGTEGVGPRAVTALAAGDFDGDGRDDLVVGTDGWTRDATINVFLTAAPATRPVLAQFGDTPGGRVPAATVTGVGRSTEPDPRVTFTLGGPGTGTLYDTGPDSGPALVLDGTTAASSLKVTTTGGLRHILAGLRVNGSLRSIFGPTTGFTDAMTVTGTVRSIRLFGGFFARMDLMGEGVPTAMTFANNQDLSLSTRSAISRLATVQWTDRDGFDDAIDAPAIGSLLARSLPGFRGVTAQFSADVNVSGGGTSLGSLRVDGTMLDATVRAAGSVGSVRVFAMQNVGVFAGVSPATRSLPASAADFTSHATIGSFRHDADLSSGVRIAAWSVGTFRVGGATGVADFARDAGEPFGLAATSVQAYSRGTGRTRVHKASLAAPGLFDTDGSYVAWIVA